MDQEKCPPLFTTHKQGALIDIILRYSEWTITQLAEALEQSEEQIRQVRRGEDKFSEEIDRQLREYLFVTICD